MNNKWLGRAIMIKAEQAQELAPEQHGSWKEKAANIQSLDKQLFYNTIQFNHQPAALCSNETKSCCNRIVLLVVALAMCHLGGMIDGIKSMVETLSTMKHHIQWCLATQNRDKISKIGMQQ